MKLLCWALNKKQKSRVKVSGMLIPRRTCSVTSLDKTKNGNIYKRKFKPKMKWAEVTREDMRRESIVIEENMINTGEQYE